MRIYLLTQALLVVSICSIASAEIINIPDDFETIQSGIDHAEGGDTVLVEPGIYEENLSIDRSLTLGSLTLMTGDPAYVDSTVLDGRQRGSVITVDGDGNSELEIRGFTIRNGNSQGYGGGINCSNLSSIWLEDLVITDNISGDDGGGIFEYQVNGEFYMRHVYIIGNRAGDDGGGLSCLATRSAIIEDCAIIDNLSQDIGGGIYGGWSGGAITYTLIGRNRAVSSGGMHLVRGTNLDHLTIVENICAGGGYNSAIYAEAGGRITNCIIYGNENDADGSPMYVNGYSFGYCLIEFGEQDVDGNFSYDNNLEGNPRFLDAEDYRLSSNSPCIDAGDPNFDPDDDGSRTDMGAFKYSPPDVIYFYGRILESETGIPIPGAAIFCQDVQRLGFPIRVSSDSLGLWGAWFQSYQLDSVAIFQFSISAAGYLPEATEREVAIGDSVRIEMQLDHAEFHTDQENILVEVDSSNSAQLSITIRNDGNGLLTWRAVKHTSGDAGYEPLVLRQSLLVGVITGDDRIEGVIFDGQSYYCAGANGNDSNMIYHVSRDGALLGSFTQPGHSRYGFKDMEWDGELIWGSGEDTVYAINRDGEMARKWPAPFDPTNNIAYDPAEEILWLSGVTSNISAFDRDGNNLGRSVERQGVRLYGLAWYGDDPDSSFLYAMNLPGNDTLQINKFNPATGAMQSVATLPPGSATGFNGAFICRNFDKYQSWVMMTIANTPADSGGDQIQVLQLQPNTEWLTIEPDHGEVAAGGESQLTVTLRTVAEDGNWAFELGEYEGEIVFTHNGRGGETIIPVHLTVVDPNAAAKDDQILPVSLELLTPYPNPFNSTTLITYSLSNYGHVLLNLYDLSGREIARLVDGNIQSGVHSVELNATDLSSGLYFVRLNSGGQVNIARLTLLK